MNDARYAYFTGGRHIDSPRQDIETPTLKEFSHRLTSRATCEWVKRFSVNSANLCHASSGALSDFPVLKSITYHWSTTGFATCTTIVHRVLETPIIEHRDCH